MATLVTGVAFGLLAGTKAGVAPFSYATAGFGPVFVPTPATFLSSPTAYGRIRPAAPTPSPKRAGFGRRFRATSAGLTTARFTAMAAVRLSTATNFCVSSRRFGRTN